MKIFMPKKTIKSKAADGVENLLVEKPMQIGLAEKSLTDMGENSFVILDFGKEIVGGIRLLTYSAKGDKKARIRLGESLTEVCSDIGEKNATNDHSDRDMVVEIQSYSDMTFGQSAFRFARVDMLGNTTARIKSITAATEIYSKPFKGKFHCDDKEVNKIFDTAAYTLRLCIQNGMIWDGVKRDRLVWIGDMHPEVCSVVSLFGSIENVENSLTFVKEQTPLPGWMNGFPTYSLWWILVLGEYYKQNKNTEYLIKQQDYLKGLIEQLDGVVKQDGTIEFPFNFIDWPTHCETEEVNPEKSADEAAGVQALAILALDCAAELLTTLNDDDILCRKISERVKRKKYKVNRYKQISALRILAGIGDDNDKELVLKGGAKGMSTFMSYYILKAASDCGLENEALGMLKEYYGAMLSLGATTFWEDFDIEWAENSSRIDKFPKKNQNDIHGDFGAFCYKGFRHSLCHGWSSGVVPYLMRVVAGIEVISAGCEEVRINPRLSGLNHVKAVYPTPYGNIYVEHRKVNGKVETAVKAPPQIKIVK